MKPLNDGRFGVIIEKGKDALETPVDPKTIKPVMPN